MEDETNQPQSSLYVQRAPRTSAGAGDTGGAGSGPPDRRKESPITLHMSYDPLYHLPSCHLVSDQDPALAHQKSVSEIQSLGMRLYGGAQYHRAMAEFHSVVGGFKCPPITREEIVNACGVEDIHVGTNYSSAVCVIAVTKARDTFEPFLHQLGSRLLHILMRLLPISVYLLQNLQNRAELRHFLDSVGGTEQSTLVDDSAGVYQEQPPCLAATEKKDPKPKADVKLSHLTSGVDSSSSIQTGETRLADLLDSTLWNRRLGPSSERIVYALVQQIFHGIREYFLASAELKFNCFLLMPVVDKLPILLRDDLEPAFSDDLDNMFDITNLQHSLSQWKRDTDIELKMGSHCGTKVHQDFHLGYNHKQGGARAGFDTNRVTAQDFGVVDGPCSLFQLQILSFLDENFDGHV